MNFTEIFIRRPVLATVVSLLIFLMGAQGIINLAIRQYPEVKETVISVTTAYPGASASLMQGFITTPVAKAVASANGVDYVTSQSSQGVSRVQVFMRLNSNPDAALTEVMSKVQQVRSVLPTDAQDPIIIKGNGQNFALMYLAFTSERMSPEQVTEYLTRVIQPRLATVNGVADAQLLGQKTFAMRIWLDPTKLAARGVTATDVVAAVRSSNFLAAPGKTENTFVAYAVETKTTLQTPESMGALPLRATGADIVRLSDVARVELAAASEETRVEFNGSPGTFIGIFPGPDANPLDVADGVRKEMPSIQAGLPEGLNGTIVYDGSRFISASIEEVFMTIGEAVLIVVLVILLFLGSFRSVVIPVVTIPLSLVGVCLVLYVMGYSLNTLTLLAMVLAIGLVVDDAIVVVENIHRHIEEGMTPLDAAIKGMHEIAGPVIAMTITLAAVYMPIGFTQGLTGSLFREFAFTLAGAVVISGVVALTLSPMMSARLLKPHGAGVSRFQRFVDKRFDGLAAWYGRRLAGSLDFRPVTLLIVVALLGMTGYMYTHTSKQLAPDEDQGAVFAIFNAPAYATSDYIETFIRKVGDIDKGMPERESSFWAVGMDGGNFNLGLWVFKPWNERKKTAKVLQQEIQAKVSDIAGLQGFVFPPPSLPGAGGGLPIQYVLQSTGPSQQVYEIAQEVRNKAMKSGRFIVVQNSLSFESPRATVTVDRDRAAALGVSVADIGTTLSVLVAQNYISKFDRDDRSYDIIPQAEQQYRSNPEGMSAFYVRGAGGQMVPLSAVVTISTQAAPKGVEQFNQLNSATLSALPLPGVTNAEGLEELRRIARETMPAGFFEEFAGESRLTIKEGSSIMLAFGLAIIVIYLVLAAQFESFRDPLIIMMSVPLSIFGAMIPLNLGVATLNIYTEVGLITLIGLITKHGILMVEFANRRREEGVGKRAAIEEAARVRLRPILMTTAAMVLGVVPLLTATGAGAAARFSIGLVIAAGMSIGTLFTLFVVPMFYTFISQSDAAMATQHPAHDGEPVAGAAE